MWASSNHDAGRLLDGVPEFLGHELREGTHHRECTVEGAEGVVPTGSTDSELGADETAVRELLAYPSLLGEPSDRSPEIQAAVDCLLWVQRDEVRRVLALIPAVAGLFS